ncbi:protein-serine/threonine kinase, partial [Haematococcus lacustris]
MLDTLAHGLREVKRKQLVGPCLQLDPFFESLLRSRISRRVLAEQHLQLGLRRPGYVGILCTQLNVAEAVEFAAAKCRQ